MNSRSLATIRRAAMRWLTDRCVIEQAVYSTGSMGQQIETWGVVASDVPCRVLMLGNKTAGGDMIAANQETLEESYEIALPHDTEIGVDYRITLESGEVYGVVRVVKELTDTVTRKAILARR